MSISIPDELNPYGKTTPFDILGVGPSSTGRDIVDARDDKLEDIDYEIDDVKKKVEARAKISEAYEQIRTPARRFARSMFVFEKGLGKDDAVKAAKKFKGLDFDFERIFGQNEGVFRENPHLGERHTVQHPITLERTTVLRPHVEEEPRSPESVVREALPFAR